MKEVTTIEEIIAFNLCVRVFRGSRTYISEESGRRYLHNVTATYANKDSKEYKKLLLKTGKMGKEYVTCFGVRCFVCTDNVAVRSLSPKSIPEIFKKYV